MGLKYKQMEASIREGVPGPGMYDQNGNNNVPSMAIANGFAIGTSLLLWIGLCVGAYFLRDKIAVYSLAAVLGFIMGGIQSISRSTYSKLIPKESTETASFFSFYG